jgi:Ice-binding-like
MFKNTKRLLTGLSLALATMLSPHAFAAQGGTSVQHFTFKTAMTSTGIDTNASGSVSGSITRQGKAMNQSLNVSVAHLNPNAAYQVTAFLGDDTTEVSVGQFTTDSKGAFKAAYMNKSPGKSPKGKQFPAALNPLCAVRELHIFDSNTSQVLGAVLNTPDKGQYLVQSSMFNTGFIPAATGNLRIKANSKSVQFRLQASRLTPNTTYVLAFNGIAAQTNMSDASGRLTLTALPASAQNVLDIQSVSLNNSTGANVILITSGLGTPCTSSTQAGLNLGTAANFVVLAGASVTSTGNTEATGNLGVWAGTSVAGFQGIVPGGPGIVHGHIHAGDATAQTAQGDLTTAYNDAAGRTLAPVDVANADLGGRTLAPGLYKSTGTLALTGTVTLDAQGDINAVWIFQVASSLNTATGSQVILSGGAKASNVFWQVGSSATLGTTTVFKGTIMANQSISLANGARLEGRALASIASVTMDSNTMTIPAP